MNQFSAMTFKIIKKDVNRDKNQRNFKLFWTQEIVCLRIPGCLRPCYNYRIIPKKSMECGFRKRFLCNNGNDVTFT